MGGRPVDYGYMWWTYGPAADPIHRGAFQTVEIFGQVIYINPSERAVIVGWSARPKPTGANTIPDADFFAAVASALRG